MPESGPSGCLNVGIISSHGGKWERDWKEIQKNSRTHRMRGVQGHSQVSVHPPCRSVAGTFPSVLSKVTCGIRTLSITNTVFRMFHGIFADTEGETRMNERHFGDPRSAPIAEAISANKDTNFSSLRQTNVSLSSSRHNSYAASDCCSVSGFQRRNSVTRSDRYVLPSTFSVRYPSRTPRISQNKNTLTSLSMLVRFRFPRKPRGRHHSCLHSYLVIRQSVKARVRKSRIHIFVAQD